MKMFKRILAAAMAAALLVACGAMGLTASAAEDPAESVEGIRWFPVDMSRNGGYDDIWEVQISDNNEYQRFNQQEIDENAPAPWIDCTFDENGALTMKRSGADGHDGNYWPRIRTLGVDVSPQLDLKTANTLYYDFTATESWSFALGFSGLQLNLAKGICEQAGTTLENSITDGVGGTYKGSLNLNDYIAEIAADSADPNSADASAISNMNVTFVPQIQIYTVGSLNASLTINSLFISSEDDTEGEKCDLMTLGLVYGDSVYESEPDDGGDAGDAGDAGDSGDGGADTATEPGDNSGSAATTTKAPASSEGGMNTWLIVGIVAAVVLVAVIIVCVVVGQKKKKKGKS